MDKKTFANAVKTQRQRVRDAAGTCRATGDYLDELSFDLRQAVDRVEDAQGSVSDARGALDNRLGELDNLMALFDDNPAKAEEGLSRLSAAADQGIVDLEPVRDALDRVGQVAAAM